MYAKIYNFVLKNGKLHFEIERILVKMPVLPVKISVEKLWEKCGAIAGLASRKSTSGLRCRRLVSCPRTKSSRRR